MLVLLMLVAAGVVSAQDTPVDVQIVKYEGLAEAVNKHRGKVVLVDFWTTLCAPCIGKFPDIAKLQSQYKKEGLVVISVSLDEMDEGPEAVKEKVRKILTSKKTNFAMNLILHEGGEVVEQKLRIQSVPSVYIFNRDGKWIQLANTEKEERVKKEVIEKLVVDYLGQK
jgi:thiol-disulfide isomerase/thioredoxin